MMISTSAKSWGKPQVKSTGKPGEIDTAQTESKQHTTFI